jgi:hypothetical protein
MNDLSPVRRLWQVPAGGGSSQYHAGVRNESSWPQRWSGAFSPGRAEKTCNAFYLTVINSLERYQVWLQSRDDILGVNRRRRVLCR